MCGRLTPFIPAKPLQGTFSRGTEISTRTKWSPFWKSATYSLTVSHPATYCPLTALITDVDSRPQDSCSGCGVPRGGWGEGGAILTHSRVANGSIYRSTCRPRLDEGTQRGPRWTVRQLLHPQDASTRVPGSPDVHALQRSQKSMLLS